MGMTFSRYDSESCDLIETRPGGFFDVCLKAESTCAHKILAMGFTYVDQGQGNGHGARVKLSWKKKKTNMVGNSN